MRDLTATLNDWLSAGAGQIGEVLIRSDSSGWELRHVSDADCTDLEVHRSPEDARYISNLDASGTFRPLKTAPTLVRGWSLVLSDAAAVRRALDYLYPAMLGVWASFREGNLEVVSLRETLGRQTGMYRVTQRIADQQARETVDRFCAGCLKQRLWEIDGSNPNPPDLSPDQIPLLCHDACNLLVAEIRKVVKTQSA
jgi:sirohydrochlorin cobaltochelatase